MKIEKKLKKEWKNILFNSIIAILTILLVVLLHKNSILLTILVCIVAITGLIRWKSKITLILFILGGIGFGVVEAIVTNYNVWRYTSPDAFGIPIWLFVIWGTTCAFIYQTALEIKKLGVKK